MDREDALVASFGSIEVYAHSFVIRCPVGGYVK
jgi:hypothetical protein